MEKASEEPINMKKTSYRQEKEDYYEQEQAVKKPATKTTERRAEREDTYKKSPPIPTKASEDRPIKNQPPR